MSCIFRKVLTKVRIARLHLLLDLLRGKPETSPLNQESTNFIEIQLSYYIHAFRLDIIPCIGIITGSLPANVWWARYTIMHTIVYWRHTIILYLIENACLRSAFFIRKHFLILFNGEYIGAEFVKSTLASPINIDKSLQYWNVIVGSFILL